MKNPCYRKQSSESCLNAPKERFVFRRCLGKGGNARVSECLDKKLNGVYAIKELWPSCAKKNEKRLRFIQEIEFLENNKGVEGVMPIISSSEKEFWYTMPIVEPIEGNLKRLNVKGEEYVKVVVSYISQCADVLAVLHDKNVGHRDLKPANIYVKDSRVVIGDFGLLDFITYDLNLTQNNYAVGAWTTIAPEMKRYPKEADSKKADVYSLAKTLWMLLERNKKGFDGRYELKNSEINLHSNPELQKLHLAEIEDLIYDATSNDPDERPTMKEFKEKYLDKWQLSMKDEKLAQLSEWEFLKKHIFGSYVPMTSVFTDKNEIVDILNLICRMPAANHALFSSRGGLDLVHAELFDEAETILLQFEPIDRCVLKPKELRVEFFDDSEWNYFLLIADDLPLIDGISNGPNSQRVIRDYPGHYVDAIDEMYGVYDYDTGISLPANAISVERWNFGRLLVVAKSGPYNQYIPSAYDGRHRKLSPEYFRQYMTLLCKTKAHLGGEYLNGVDEVVFPQKDKYSFANNEMIGTSYREYNITDVNGFVFSMTQDDFKKTEKGCLSYSFKFESKFSNFSEVSHSPETFYLSQKGNVIEFTPDDVLTICDTDEALNVLPKLNREFEEWCKKEGAYGFDFDFGFDIEMKRIKRPTKLMTPEDVVRLGKNADDRQRNQFVIDGDGDLRMIQGLTHSHCYSVRYESFAPRCINVGKYASWHDERIGEIYFDLLAKWAMHLKTGKEQYADLFTREKISVSALIEAYDNAVLVEKIMRSDFVQRLNKIYDCLVW